MNLFQQLSSSNPCRRL